MRGHLKQRTKGSWSVIVYLGQDKQTNKKSYKWYTFKGTKTEAEKFLTEKLRELDTGTWIDSKNMSVEEYFNYWYEETCVKKLSPSTYESYRRNMNKYIIPAFKKIKLKDLTPLHLQTFYKMCSEKGLSNTTVRYIHRIIHSALGQAMKWQLILRNVADNVEPPTAKRYEATVLNDKEITCLIHNIEHTDIYIPVMIAISTGMRRGEVLGLTWKNIDLKEGSLKVVQTLSPTKNGLVFLPPKTNTSNRKIIIPPTLIEILKKYKIQQERQKKKLGNYYEDQDLVCCLENGKPINPTRLNHKFKDILERSDLPHIRFHDLRHSHASLLLSQGVQPKVISERLGHSNIAITMNLYSHIYEETNREVANNFDVFLKTS